MLGRYPENETKSRGSPSSRESPAAANVTGPRYGSNGRVTGASKIIRSIPLYAQCAACGGKPGPQQAVVAEDRTGQSYRG